VLREESPAFGKPRSLRRDKVTTATSSSKRSSESESCRFTDLCYRAMLRNSRDDSTMPAAIPMGDEGKGRASLRGIEIEKSPRQRSWQASKIAMEAKIERDPINDFIGLQITPNRKARRGVRRGISHRWGTFISVGRCGCFIIRQIDEGGRGRKLIVTRRSLPDRSAAYCF